MQVSEAVSSGCQVEEPAAGKIEGELLQTLTNHYLSTLHFLQMGG